MENNNENLRRKKELRRPRPQKKQGCFTLGLLIFVVLALFTGSYLKKHLAT